MHTTDLEKWREHVIAYSSQDLTASLMRETIEDLRLMARINGIDISAIPEKKKATKAMLVGKLCEARELMFA